MTSNKKQNVIKMPGSSYLSIRSYLILVTYLGFFYFVIFMQYANLLKFISNFKKQSDTY